eukprot:UN34624
MRDQEEKVSRVAELNKNIIHEIEIFDKLCKGKNNGKSPINKSINDIVLLKLNAAFEKYSNERKAEGESGSGSGKITFYEFCEIWRSFNFKGNMDEIRPLFDKYDE